MNSRTNLKPGWGITEEQHNLFWRLWSAAWRYQGWPASDAESKRREVLAELGFESAKHIDSTDGFDRVKQRLEALAGRVHNEPSDAGQRRRLVSKIGTALADLGEAQYPEHSLNTILRKRFKIIEGVNSITDLETRELLNLVGTLTARLASWKRRASRQASCSEPAPVGNTIFSVHAADLPRTGADCSFMAK